MRLEVSFCMHLKHIMTEYFDFPLDDLDADRRGVGNTETTPASKKSDKKQISQRLNWFFTFNNYPEDAIDALDACFREICTDWIFQEEIGEKCGTPHLQGNIRLKKSMRFTEFSPDLRIHWEPTRLVVNAKNYCNKDSTRKPGGQVRFGGGWIPKKELKIIEPTHPWQREVINLIQYTEPDDRKVYWYWSEKGGVGKSSLAKYLIHKFKALFIDEGKKADIMNLIFHADMDRDNCAVVIDIPRANGDKVSYKSIESIKNGCIYSPKYEGGYKLFNSPHVICFANCEPDYEQLSSDRWVVKQIDKIDENEIV